MEKRTKESRKRINSLILLIAFTAIMLIVSTYAWFTMQKDITLSNIRGTIEVVENMEISLDAKNWYQEIDLGETGVLSTAQTTRSSNGDSNAKNVEPTELLPVSTTGTTAEVTASTGSTVLPLYSGKATGTKLTNVAQINSSSEEASHGYFAFDIYIKNTSKDGAKDVLQLNLNSGVKVLADTIQKTVNGVTSNYIGDNDSGLQNTIRVGLALYNGTVSYASTQNQVLTSTASGTAKITDVAIWEPNAKYHAPYIVDNNNKILGGQETGNLTFDWDDAFTTYALTDSSAGTVDNVYDWRTSNTKVGPQNTLQTDIAVAPVKDASGAINYVGTDYRVAVPTGTKPYNLQSIKGGDFEIESNKISRLRVYVWLEGQDVDAINLATHGGGIEVDLGFTKDDEVGEVDYFGRVVSTSGS